MSSVSAADALERLREGNRRFVAGDRTGDLSPTSSPQLPFAVILGCSDSRVPVEIVFDQGFGDLFIVRVAGNVVAPSLVGSIEFAIARFGVQLVVVLGHSGCGAVDATLEALRRPADEMSANLRDIIDRIRPAIEPLASDGDVPMETAVLANVRASVEALRDSVGASAQVVGAEYVLETGEVLFLE